MERIIESWSFYGFGPVTVQERPISVYDMSVIFFEKAPAWVFEYYDTDNHEDHGDCSAGTFHC